MLGNAAVSYGGDGWLRVELEYVYQHSAYHQTSPSLGAAGESRDMLIGDVEHARACLQSGVEQPSHRHLAACGESPAPGATVSICGTTLSSMAMGKRSRRWQQPSTWVASSDLPRSAGHPFYERLNRVLHVVGFDCFVEAECAKFYADGVGRPSLAPGRYFRMLLLEYFEGLESERAMA